MIGLTPPDRWTCPEPSCGRTVVPQVRGAAELAAAIHSAQERHAQLHSSPLETALRALDEQPNAARRG